MAILEIEKIGMTVNIGISETGRKETAEGLSGFLADTYILYLKTHSFHWNVTGSQFQTLHLMFETQYNELWQAVDLIAERIRALGFFVRATHKDFLELASLKEESGVPPADSMIALLVQGHETAARTARTVLKIAESAGDASTVDLLTQRMEVHEKTAWMLRSLLA